MQQQLKRHPLLPRSVRAPGGASPAAASPFAAAAAEPLPTASGDPWTAEEAAEEAQSGEIWRELSADLGPGDSGARAAAAALARGDSLPPETEAAVRADVPGLLHIEARLGSSAAAGVPAAAAAAAEAGGGAAHAHTPPPAFISLPMRCSCEPGAADGACVFTLETPASAKERQRLESFAARLGCEVQRAQHHLAKQQLEVRGGWAPAEWGVGRTHGKPSSASAHCLPTASRSPKQGSLDELSQELVSSRSLPLDGLPSLPSLRFHSFPACAAFSPAASSGGDSCLAAARASTSASTPASPTPEQR